MKETVKEMLAHPLATVIVLGALGSAVASIISAARGGSVKPFVDVNFTKNAAK